MQPSPDKPSLLVKPTVDTKYHIDYSWWETSGEDLRTYVLSHLLPEQRDQLSQTTEERVIDYVDPDTGEVFQMDELGLAIQLAAKDPDYVGPQTALVDAIFRVFLANSNTPLSIRDLAERTNRPANTILKMLSGHIWKGIRPYQP
ncbi:MAG: hypothetical protein KC547_15410 [Anaerolineae bacterium]|nr:hypothetical protein [Anaerolineae bacterium]MCA9909478.1 hypothetical protein [Anaerolineae bacterium]